MNYMGIDVGSTTVKSVIINENNEIIFSEYMRHYSDIKNTVKALLEKARDSVGDIPVKVMITGSGGLLLSKIDRFTCKALQILLSFVKSRAV